MKPKRMVNGMGKKRVLKIVFLVLAVIVTGCCVVISFKAWELLKPPDERVAAEIAGRIGTEPTWDAIFEYVQETPIGITRSQVHERLDRIGEYFFFERDLKEWDSQSNTYIYHHEEFHFSELNTSKGVGQWIFYYDENFLLIRVSHVGL